MQSFRMHAAGRPNSSNTAAAVVSTNGSRLPHAGDDGDVPEVLKKFVDGSAQLPVKTYFIGGYGEQHS